MTAGQGRWHARDPRRGALTETVARATGTARAVVWSFGPVWRRRRMDAFYRRFLRPGDLALDVGAHAGSRVSSFRRIGARVVAVEPVPDLAMFLRRRHGGDAGVVVEECAVAAEAGTAVLYLSRRNPSVASLDPRWAGGLRTPWPFRTARSDTAVTVRTTTLDELVATHGAPRFCKLDVEGSEPDALAGLTAPLAAMSVEYVPAAADRAVACVRRLGELGRYRFALSTLETWRLTAWGDEAQTVGALERLPADAPPGDLYAFRTG